MFFRQKQSGSKKLEPQEKQRPPGGSGNITLGVNVETGEPVTFPRKSLVHMFIRGRTRSGKSSLTIVSLIYQLLDVE